MNEKKFIFSPLPSLIEGNKQLLRQRFRAFRGEDTPGPVLQLQDLLDALPYYRQVLLVGPAEAPTEKLFRHMLFGLLEKQNPVAYFTQDTQIGALFNDYCARQTGIAAKQLETGNFSPKQLKAVNAALDSLLLLPLHIACPAENGSDLFAATATSKDNCKFWAVSSLKLLLPAASAEDIKTQHLTLLSRLKETAQARQQTHLLLLQAETEVTEILRPETLKIPDLLLLLSEETKDGHTRYRLSCVRNEWSDPFDLTLVYDEGKSVFLEG